MIESRESCYRVAVLSGSLEVSARLRNSDDLELLMSVLEANKVLFAKPEESTPVVAMKASVKADGPMKKTSAKPNQSEPRAFMDAGRSEPEILTLT